MNKIMKRICALVLAILCVLGCCACGGESKADESTTFTWWQATAENASYYNDYDENPVINYITATKTFENSEGEQVHIDFDFTAGVTGSEADNFNNMIATGTYTDIFDPTYYAGSQADLYKAGTILDLTEYVEQYMPNFMAWFEEHPEYKKYLTTNVDGEEKILCLPIVYESIDMYDQWYGYAYRRDWIVKYGVQPDTLYDPMKDEAPTANPNAGKKFTGAYTLDINGNAINTTVCDDTVNGDSWVDDVVFPSGNTDPIYISDWEWMMEIFEKAMEAEGIQDGYCLSVYYPGYLAVGDLVSGFGGIGPMWYLDKDGVCQFGAVSEGFKSYLECMNRWYETGWLDQRFMERSGDAFYQIDNTTVRQGKVGIWLATASELMSRMQNADLPHTEGLVAYTCASPINDVYGAEETKYQVPISICAPEMMGGGICVTDKAKDKDLKVLFAYLDYLFTEEGVLLMNGGLTAEQQAQINDPIYDSYGLEYGCVPVEGEDGKTLIDLHNVLYVDDGGISSAMTGGRAWRYTASGRIIRKDTATYLHMRENWVYYDAYGMIGGLANSRLSSDQMALMQKLSNRIGSEYMAIEVPKFITGEYDLDEQWETFVSDLKKRNYQSLVDAYNEALGNN